jgi:hypothetical protein
VNTAIEWDDVAVKTVIEKLLREERAVK